MDAVMRACAHVKRGELDQMVSVTLTFNERLRVDVPASFGLCAYCAGRLHSALLEIPALGVE